MFYKHGEFDYKKLSEVAKIATRFLDNVGTMNNFPSAKFTEWYANNRPIGIGIMGYADALLQLRIKYGSTQSIKMIEEVMSTIQISSYLASEELGKERGVPVACKLVGDITGNYRRNITTVSIAPTGSIAFIAECSHGIEPIFSPSFERTDERGEKYMFTHPLQLEPYFVSAVGHDNVPTWQDQIDIVAAAQKYTDSGISKTINLPETATVQDVLNAYVYAWESNCKGITVYRDNSRKVQVLNAKVTPTKVIEADEYKDVILQSCPTGVCAIS